MLPDALFSHAIARRVCVAVHNMASEVVVVVVTSYINPPTSPTHHHNDLAMLLSRSCRFLSSFILFFIG
jgi:hypothetical protein